MRIMAATTLFGSVSLKEMAGEKLSNATFRLHVENHIKMTELFPPPYFQNFPEFYEHDVAVPIAWLPRDCKDSYMKIRITANPIIRTIYERELYATESRNTTIGETLDLREGPRFVQSSFNQSFLSRLVMFLCKAIPELNIK